MVVRLRKNYYAQGTWAAYEEKGGKKNPTYQRLLYYDTKKRNVEAYVKKFKKGLFKGEFF